jgi:cell division protein ZapA (FtsZ GTPase activity inhibitor)
MRELADVAEIARNARMDTISHILEHQYRVNLTDDEKELLADLDTQTIIDRISARHSIKIEGDDIKEGIQSVAQRIIEYLRDLGFKISLSDPQEKIEVALSDNPTTIQEKVARMLTVQSLVEFVVAAGPTSSRS